ncbi:MAG: ComEC/Rec2 family competence protein [Armatimonadota bacterium]
MLLHGPGVPRPVLMVPMTVLTEILSPLLRRPLLCLALLWMAGIVLAAHISFPWGAWGTAAGILLTIWLLISRLHPAIAHCAFASAVLCLGAALHTWQSTPPPPDTPAYLPAGGVTLIGYPQEMPSVTPNGWTGLFRVTKRRTGEHWSTARNTILLRGRGTVPAPGRCYLLLAAVQPPEESRNPFGFSQKAWLAERGVRYLATAYTVQPLPQPAPMPGLQRWRQLICDRLAATMPGAHGSAYAQLFNSILLGMRGAALPEQMTEQFRRAGTIHLVVVSGSQVALLAMVLLFPLWLIPHGRERTTYPYARRLLLLFSLPILALYVALADRGPSIDRALLMVLLSALAIFLALSRYAQTRSFRPDALTLLAAAALVLLTARTVLLFSPSFQLSFGAVLGLITITPTLMRLLRHLFGHVSLLPSATLGAQLMTYPILAWHFGAIPLLGPLSNLIAVPVVTLLLPNGLVTLVFSLCAPPLAMALNQVNLLLLRLFLTTSAVTAQCPGAELHWVIRSGWPVVIYLLLLAVLVTGLSRWADSIDRNWQVPAGREPCMW